MDYGGGAGRMMVGAPPLGDGCFVLTGIVSGTRDAGLGAWGRRGCWPVGALILRRRRESFLYIPRRTLAGRHTPVDEGAPSPCRLRKKYLDR